MLWAILLCELGEDNPSGDGQTADNGGTPDNGNGDGDPNADPDSNKGDPGQGGAAPATPKYGEFGDAPSVDQLYQALTGRNKEFETLRGKVGATEKNLSMLRKTLEGSGIRAVAGEDGNLRLEVAEKEPTKRQSKFTDAHKGLFDEKVLEAIKYLVEDHFETSYDARQRTTREEQTKMRQFVTTKQEANDLMMAYFPMLEPKFDVTGKATNAEFNQAFYDRATELWEEKYKQDPRGELLAALQVARELNIIPTALSAAKKEGVELGKKEKKILGPVTPSGSGPGGKGKMSRDEYLKLSPEKREEYDKTNLENKK